MTWRIPNAARLGAISLLGAVLLAGAALADGMPKGGRVKKAETTPAQPLCTLSANVALTTDYIFRGFSQTAEGPAIQGGFDATCGLLYFGVFASSLDWGVVERPGADATWAYLELDPYAGIKGKHGQIAWDIGVIYYGYPNSARNNFGIFDERFRNEYLEIKAGLSGEVWKDGTLGVTAFYSPNYQYETGSVWTLEVGFAQVLPQVLPKHWGLTPTLSALVGQQLGNDGPYAARVAGGDDSYTYWNAGVALGFLEKWSIDLRYWDTSLDRDFCSGPTFQCDERFVATLKFTY
jgi:uncharacterized protein (TIGR02001 family)